MSDFNETMVIQLAHNEQIAALKLAHENISGKLAAEKAYSLRCVEDYNRADQKVSILSRTVGDIDGQLFAVRAATFWQRLVYLFTRRLPK